MSESLNNAMETVSFRRFLSYIYAYEDDTKLRNVGFAKVEVRAQRVRFQVTVSGIFQKGGRPLEFCLVDGNMRRIPVGQLQLQNGRGEYRGSSSMDNMWESGLAFSQIYGLCLQGAGNRRHYYMTLWREPRPFIHAAEVSSDVESSSQESSEDVAEEAEENIAAAEVVQGKPATAEVVQGKPAAAEVVQEKPAAVEAVQKEPAAAEVVQKKSVAVEVVQEEPAVVEVQSKTAETEIQRELMAVQIQKEPVETGAQRASEPELMAAAISDGDDEMGFTEEAAKLEIKTENEERENSEGEVQQDLEAASELLKQQSAMAPAGTSGTKIVNKRSVKVEKRDKRMELWKKFCSHYPHVDIRPIYVDDSVENGLANKGRICEVIRIRPNDIGRLPKNNWILAHNSFLQNAYNHSRHLILFRVENMENTEGSRWFIGLPGEKNEQESLVAEVFGFKKYLKCRNGGFWYTEIFMGAY